MANYMEPAQVQMFLDNLGPMEQFGIIFAKNDGTQRGMVATLDPDSGTSVKVSIACMDEYGAWKRFNKDRVLWIGYPDQIESILELMQNKESV